MVDCGRFLEQNIGWTIIDSKTIESWRNPGKEKKDGFEGKNVAKINIQGFENLDRKRSTPSPLP